MLVENELKKLRKERRRRKHEEEESMKIYLVFQSMYRYFKRVVNSDYILSWKSKLLSDENITPSSASHNFLNPLLNYLDTKARIRFNGSCLKLDKLHTLTEK